MVSEASYGSRSKSTPDFLNFRHKFKLIEKEVVFLNWDELIKLYNFDVPEEGSHVRLKDISGRNYKKTVRNRSSLVKTRDLFCFVSVPLQAYDIVIWQHLRERISQVTL